ncbi:MAG: ATP-binding protein [Anaerolineales bacterium]|nr:ATP-binding protein [Anaerolineales bacterium]
MKQWVVLSGKGGTGKTSVTAAFAHLAQASARPVRTVLADADVDAANLELVLAPQLIEQQDFRGGQIAIIDAEACASCGECAQVCRFDAILPPAEGGYAYRVDPIACDGCAACVYQCPSEAIRMQDQVVGQWYRSQTRYGPLFHANLRPAQENSGKLVTLIKQYARLLALDEDYELALVDGPPGIGCPVISAASGANLALIVAEPTVSGVHDMRRILGVTEHFGLQSLVIINKADIHPQGTEEIEAFCRQNGIKVIGRIPYDMSITEAMVNAMPVTEHQPASPASLALKAIWEQLKVLLEEKQG